MALHRPSSALDDNFVCAIVCHNQEDKNELEGRGLFATYFNVKAVGVVIEKVSKVFGKKRVLNSVDIAIEPQEFQLSGRRAAVRHTLRIISGFYQPDGGRILRQA